MVHPKSPDSLSGKQICFDGRLINGSGISTYIVNLLQSFQEQDHSFGFQLLTKSKNQLSSHPALNEHYSQSIYRKPIYSLGEQLFLPPELKSCNLLHTPHYNAPLFYPGKLVITVHDVCHLAMQQYFPGIGKRLYSSVFLGMILKRADHVITVSRFSKLEILNRFDVNPEKVSVIHNGISPHYTQKYTAEIKTVLKKYQLPGEYLLYIGNIKPHKNITRLISAYLKANQDLKSIPPLVLCGSKQDFFDVFAQVDRSKTDDHTIKNKIILTGYVDYDDLPGIYSGASAFIYPSLYEGFGLPPLEAMSCGIPVAASNSSAIPEILGDSALLFDPYDEQEMSSAIIKILTDSSLRDQLIKKGFERVQQYQWKNAARAHLDVYEKLVEQ